MYIRFVDEYTLFLWDDRHQRLRGLTACSFSYFNSLLSPVDNVSFENFTNDAIVGTCAGGLVFIGATGVFGAS